MRLITRLLEIFVAIFIAITGVMLMPQVSELTSTWFQFVYALSIMLSTVYFLALAFSGNKQEKEQ